MFTRSALAAVSLATLLTGALLASGANAAVSVGISTNCDSDGHCVEGTATSSNAGFTINAAVNEVGAAVAVCKGVGPGATVIEITCSVGANSRTMSFPGSAGAVPIVTTTGTLARKPVCWNVLGIFPVLTGAPHPVSTSGCAMVAV